MDIEKKRRNCEFGSYFRSEFILRVPDIQNKKYTRTMVRNLIFSFPSRNTFQRTLG